MHRSRFRYEGLYGFWGIESMFDPLYIVAVILTFVRKNVAMYTSKIGATLWTPYTSGDRGNTVLYGCCPRIVLFSSQPPDKSLVNLRGSRHLS
jgi:hypothetical protein